MTEPISFDAPMRTALDLAVEAAGAGDVPVGAVLLDPDGNVVAADRNRREELGDPTAHAEMLVLSARAREIGDWRLNGHTLVVTLEPCPMCAGAIVLIAVPMSFLVEDWAACLSAVGLVLIYGGVSFFLRPQVDAEGRGWRAAIRGCSRRRWRCSSISPV